MRDFQHREKNKKSCCWSTCSETGTECCPNRCDWCFMCTSNRSLALCVAWLTNFWGSGQLSAQVFYRPKGHKWFLCGFAADMLLHGGFCKQLSLWFQSNFAFLSPNNFKADFEDLEISTTKTLVVGFLKRRRFVGFLYLQISTSTFFGNLALTNTPQKQHTNSILPVISSSDMFLHSWSNGSEAKSRYGVLLKSLSRWVSTSAFTLVHNQIY